MKKLFSILIFAFLGTVEAFSQELGDIVLFVQKEVSTAQLNGKIEGIGYYDDGERVYDVLWVWGSSRNEYDVLQVRESDIISFAESFSVNGVVRTFGDSIVVENIFTREKKIVHANEFNVQLEMPRGDYYIYTSEDVIHYVVRK